jgi:RNA polymerase sigma factor for flagellar operon FliA
MPDQTDFSELLLDALPAIEAIAAAICRRYAVRGDDADEFNSWLRERLIENDYALLRKYRPGETQLNTYLTVVATRLFHSHTREIRGRWRSSAAAERLGDVARELEALVYRDGASLSEAGERLRSAGRTDLSDAELARVLAQLPVREPLRPMAVAADPLEEAPSIAQADDRVWAEEAERQRDTVHAALGRALRNLEPEERTILQMHLGQGRRVADIARALNLDQRSLYRRIQRLVKKLRGEMEAEGISAEDVREVLDEESGPERA